MHFDWQYDYRNHKILKLQVEVQVFVHFEWEDSNSLLRGKIEGSSTWEAGQSCRNDLVSNRWFVSYFSCV